MRRSADASRLTASRLAAFPPVTYLPPYQVRGRLWGELRLLSHASVCGHVVGWPLPFVAAPGVDSPDESPWADLRLLSPPPSPASGIRPWAECVQRQPVPSSTSRATDARHGSTTERRSPCTSTRSIAADGGASGSHNTSPFTRVVSTHGGGPSSLPASGRRPKATQHNRRRTDR